MTSPARNTVAPIGKRFSLNDSGWLELFSTWYIWLPLAAIVFGALALMASNGMRTYSKRVGLIQTREIAFAGRQAAIAEEGAAKANARAAQLEVEAKKSGELIADANARASEANARAKEAESQVAQANAASKNAVAKVAAAEARIAEANREAAEANRIAENERLERIKLEEKMAPRRLSTSQKATFASALRGYPGATVKIVVFIATSDGIPFSTDIMEAINNAPGWKAEHTGQTTMAGQLRGIALLVKDDSHPPPQAVPLQNAFRQIGIEAPGVNYPDQPEGVVTIFIAPKL